MRANGVRAEEGDQPVGRVHVVGRVREGDVVRAGVEPLSEAQRVAAADRGPLADAEGVDVAPERLEGGGRELHEGGVRGAARERLEAERAAPGEEIEHPRAGELGRDDAHPGLPHPVGRGTHPAVARDHEPPAAELAGDDTHPLGRKVILSAAKEPYPGSCPLRFAQGDRGLWAHGNAGPVRPDGAEPRLETQPPVPLVAAPAGTPRPPDRR